jgi:hypothetical protein
MSPTVGVRGLQSAGGRMCGEDIVQIVNVINLYPVAVDTRRWDLFDRVFTEDAHTEFGGAAKWNDLTSLKRDFEIIHRPFEATLHAFWSAVRQDGGSR